MTADERKSETDEFRTKLAETLGKLMVAQDELTAANEQIKRVREETIEEAVKALEDLPINEASEYAFNTWQACAMVRKLAVLKVRALKC